MAPIRQQAIIWTMMVNLPTHICVTQPQWVNVTCYLDAISISDTISCCNAWHDDVIKWNHFPRYFPRYGPRGGALVFSLISAWLNSWVNNREGGDLGRYRTYYDVTVMVVLVRRALYISLLPNSLDTSVLMEVTHYKTIIVPILFIHHKIIFSTVVNTVVKYLRQHACFCITYSRGLI